MIVGCLGYGYIAKYLLKELSANGVRCYGITDNQLSLKKERLENITLFSRKMTLDVINKCTHLVITAPPEKTLNIQSSFRRQKLLLVHIKHVPYKKL